MTTGFYGSMGQAVAERTVSRYENGKWETWDDIAHRVSLGNSKLAKGAQHQVEEYHTLKCWMGKKVLLTSGRHLQHGDMTQPYRNMEVFTNCSTAFTTFALAYLLLNGSGVGRSYDDDLMLTDWDNIPNVICVLDESHPDFDYTRHITPREAKHRYGDKVKWITVGDHREGWGHLIEELEVMAWEKIHRDELVVADFTKVRPKNSPIAGMQNKPASGPVPLMDAIGRIVSLKGSGMPRWKQAMFIDHYIADCVLMGGVRRSARIATKHWKDPSAIEFINIKRPIEFQGKSIQEIITLRKQRAEAGLPAYQSFLWTANNTIGVDKEFWELLKLKRRNVLYKSDLAKHARAVWKALTEAAYADGTGEPGILNLDAINTEEVHPNYMPKVGNKLYPLQDNTHLYIDRLVKAAKQKAYLLIVNPCGEIRLALWGAYCTIADLCLYFAENEEEMHEAARASVRFLMRVNQMDSLYASEVQRTNRIGIGLTGVHETAWKFFKFTFLDLIDEEKSKPFWEMLARIRVTIEEEAKRYAAVLGVVVPFTFTTVKPSGTISKLFGLTEGWHLPSMKFYMRWVQFRSDNPLVEQYRNEGYPTRVLKTYRDTTIVGFPTVPFITEIMPSELIVTAAEATPEQQYQWLMLGEKYWLGDSGNQISYTLKYDPEKVDYEGFTRIIQEYQSRVRCCSVMPQERGSSYEYTPEEIIDHNEYLSALANIKKKLNEDIGAEHLDCGAGGCPIEFRKNNEQANPVGS